MQCLILLYSINECLFVSPKHLDQADFVSSVHEFRIFIEPRNTVIKHQDGPELVEWKARQWARELSCERAIVREMAPQHHD